MNRPKINTEISTFQANTYNTKEAYLHIIERAAKLLADPESIKRIEASECVVCFYSSKIGGAVMTNQECGICDKTMHFSSTATDNFCLDCAVKYNLCKHCGGDIDMKYRRKVWIK